MTSFLPVGAAFPGTPPFGSDLSGTVRLGAAPLGHGACSFSVWAPSSGSVDVRIESGGPGASRRAAVREVPLSAVGNGYFAGVLEDVPVGTRYEFVLDDRVARPDPASRWQPDGVHGPSAVVDLGEFQWTDDQFVPTPLERMVITEVHVGTFTPEGTLSDASTGLRRLADVGFTAVELMPVHQFPGRWNWGYDGVLLHAVQDTYGGPSALQAFVHEAHRCGLAVILDVVYNHLGPEGNVLTAFGPYLTDRYRTPWGPAVNVDGPGSDEVRRFLVDNALQWLRDYHVDALRLDAVHEIVDSTAHTFLADLSAAVEELAAATGRPMWLIAESADDDPRLLRPRSTGGAGLDAQWNDEFHHALHSVLTGERAGYYADFGRMDQLAATVTEGFWFRGQHSLHRRRRHGTADLSVDPRHLVIFAQNHDQIGNRPGGDRLASLVPPEALRLAAGLVLLSPGIPLLFMGEEYGERRPFPYFVDHGDEGLLTAVRDGRAAEMQDLGLAGVDLDPTAASTRAAAVLRPEAAEEDEGRALLRLHRELIRLRGTHPLFAGSRHTEDATQVQGHVLSIVRSLGGERAVVVANLSPDVHDAVLPDPPSLGGGSWELLLDSTEREFGGDGSALRLPDADGRITLGRYAFAVFEWAVAVRLEEE